MTKWANAADCVPEPAIIAGTQLRPFCLGHHLLLRRLGLPFAGSPTADCAPSEILIGILICAQTYDATLEQLHADEWNKVQVKWLAGVAKRRTDLVKVEASFREYLTKGYAIPPLNRYDGKDGIKFSAPWELLLKVRLQMSGLSEFEVLNGYLPLRWFEYFTAVEITGADKCEDTKRWKPTFWDYDNAMKLEAAKNG